MFIRQEKNKSGSVSVQIISKHAGKYRVERTIGSSSSTEGIDILLHQARHELSKLVAQPGLFISENEASIEGFLNSLSNSKVQVSGPELVFGKICDAIGFNAIKEDAVIDDNDLATLNSKELSKTVYNNDTTAIRGQRYTSLQEHFRHAETELNKTGVTRQLLWIEYKQQYPDSYNYSQYCYHLEDPGRNR